MILSIPGCPRWIPEWLQQGAIVVVSVALGLAVCVVLELGLLYCLAVVVLGIVIPLTLRECR